MEFLNSSEDGIDLEGETPPLWLFVVFLKHVDVFATQVLPIRNRLFNPFSFRNLLTEDLKEGGLATTDVSFDCKAVISSLELWIEFKVFEILIQTSR